MTTDAEQGPHVFQSLWIGPRLSPLEQLCIKSFLQCGHTFVLFAYEAVANVPSGCAVEDARQIVPDRELFLHRSGPFVGSPAGFSDRFRYDLLAARGGWWVDTDVLCLRRDIRHTPYAFAKDEDHAYNGAILKAPRDSAFLARARAFAVAAGADIAQNELGPPLITRLVEELDLEREAWAKEDFFPLAWDHVLEFLDPGEVDRIESLTAGSTFVHFSTNMLRIASVLKDVRPPRGSYLDRMFDLHGIEFPASARYEWSDIEPQYEFQKEHWMLYKELARLRAEIQQLHVRSDRLAAKEAEVDALSAALAQARREQIRVEQSVSIQLFLKLSDRLYRVIGKHSLPARAIRALLRVIGRVFVRPGAP
jgi:hypothetical protein